MAAAPPVALDALCPPGEGAAAAATAEGRAGRFVLAPAEPLPTPRAGLIALPERLHAAEAARRLLDPSPLVPPAVLYVLRDVVVHVEAGIIFSEGRPVRESVPAWRRDGLADFLAMPRFAPGWKAGITAELDDPVVAVWNAPARNYSHWHYDGLGALTMAREALGLAPRLLLPHRFTPFHAESLRLLPWANAGAAVRAAGLVRCRTLVWASPLAVSVSPTPESGRAFDAIRGAVVSPAAVPSSRIYVARFDAPDRRGIENEQEVATALEREGFEIVTPGRLTYAEQVERFARARVVVGPHGAGLTNAGFVPEGGMLVELHPASYGGASYVRLALRRGLVWRGWLMEESSGRQHAVRCTVDVPAFIAQLGAWGALA